MTATAIGLLVAVNIIFWTEVTTRKPAKLGVFEKHPMWGIGLVCVAALVGAFIHGRL